jgi:chromate reductase
MNSPLTILGFAGSLRKASYNRAALRAAQELAPEGIRVEAFELNGLPIYNQDDEQRPPAKVIEVKARIRAADAILFVTPEHNYSIPSVLKNAIDWASRPYGDSAWQGKPVAVMGATVGMLGTARAQGHLRESFVFLNMFPINRPEVMIPFATEKFDADGNLIDDKSRQKIRELLEALAAWTRRLQPGERVAAENI